MAAGNRSPLGFGPILLFHLCVLAVGVLLQNAFGHNRVVFYGILGAGLGLGAFGIYWYWSFLWDVFRSFKSAATLITLLVLSCVLGTFIIQDLDLRRADNFDHGVTGTGKPPPYGVKNQFNSFAKAQTHGWLWLFPSEERRRMTEEKVVLSSIEKTHVELRRQAFGDDVADNTSAGLLRGKQQTVDKLTTDIWDKDHRQGLYDFYLWTRKLHLFDIFESWWFYMLLGLIAANVIVGTFARGPWSKRDFGLVVTHAGILIILSGALLDRLVAQEGYINYVYGQPDKQISSVIRDDKNRMVHHLPFRVQLDRFATEYYHELLVRRFDWSKRADGSAWTTGNGGMHGNPLSTAKPYPIRTGIPHKFEQGEITVTVTEFKPRVFIETKVEDVADGPLNPGIELGIYNDPAGGWNLLDSGNNPRWWYAKHPTWNTADLGDIRIDYVWADTEAEYDRLKKSAPVPDNGTLVMRKGGQQVRADVRLGAKTRVQLGDRMLQIEFFQIRSAIADKSNVNLDRRLQRTEEPVLWLKVNSREIAVPRDDSAFTSGFGILQGVEFRFDWPDSRDKGLFSIYRVIGAEGRPLALVQADYDGNATTSPLRRGETVALLGYLKGRYIGVRRAVRSGHARRVIREVSDAEFLAEGGREQDRLLSAWAKIKIEGPSGKVTREVTPYDGAIPYGDAGGGRPLYYFRLFKTEMALDWFSVLTVINHEGKRVKSHNVQVNSPLTYGGYRFFQATAATRPDGLSVSGISVTNNPGVNFMYVGFYVLVLGVCFVFFLRPVIDRDRRNGGILFDFGGRLDRGTFWDGGMKLLLAIDAAAILVTILLGSVGVFWFFVLFWWIPTLWPRLALHTKRCHDVGRSGWFMLVPIWALFETWGLRSYPGENRYGAPPEGLVE